MPEPMTSERLAEIRERAESVKTWKGYHAEPVPQLLDVDVPALLAEVERLTGELAKRPKSRLGEQVNRLSNAVGDLERERDDALAEVERLRTELAEVTHALEVTGEKLAQVRGQRNAAEAERDEARQDGKRTARVLEDAGHDREEQRRRAETAEAERDEAREQVARVRAEVAAWQAAGRTTDLEGDAGDHLTPLADWQEPNGNAPDWLVRAVADLLAPIAAERDRITKERDALARANSAGERWARQQIDGHERTITDLTGKIQRIREQHSGQCGGGCAAEQCECEPDDLVCAECETPAPCATLRALDGTATP